MKFSSVLIVTTLLVTGGSVSFVDLAEAEALPTPPARYTNVMAKTSSMMVSIEALIADTQLDAISK